MNARMLWLALALVAGTLCAQTPAPIVSPAQWMHSLAEGFLVPGYERLNERAKELDTAVQALCAAPATASLSVAQARWRSASLAWRPLAALPIGPTLTRRSLRRFDFSPTRPAAVEAAIAHSEAGGASERIGVAARGLPALEYLLFRDSRLALAAQAPRCRYAARLAADFSAEAEALAAEWRKWGAQWREAESDSDAARAAMTDTVNALVGTLDQLRVRRLKASGGDTRAQLLATFDGAEQVLAGANRVLAGLGHLELAERQALPAARGRAVEAVGRLQGVVAGDVAEALRVTVGFNESDGD
jgi:predicted lipoprotein